MSHVTSVETVNAAVRKRTVPSTMWPIHDLVVTEFMAWILPTHMKSHLIRFAVGLGALWLCLKQAETSLANTTFFVGLWKPRRRDVCRVDLLVSPFSTICTGQTMDESSSSCHKPIGNACPASSF